MCDIVFTFRIEHNTDDGGMPSFGRYSEMCSNIGLIFATFFFHLSDPTPNNIKFWALWRKKAQNRMIYLGVGAALSKAGTR